MLKAIKILWKIAAFSARIICSLNEIFNDFSDTFLTDPGDVEPPETEKQKPFHKIIFQKVKNFLEI